MSRLTDLMRLRAFIDEEILVERARTEPDTNDLIEAVADLYELPPDFLGDPNLKGRTVIQARMAVCWLLRQRGLSTPQIGRIIGRDHTTVLYAERVVGGDPSRMAILRNLVDGPRATEPTPEDPAARLAQIVRAAS